MIDNKVRIFFSAAITGGLAIDIDCLRREPIVHQPACQKG